MSKVTSICGTPRGAGGMPSRWKVPSFLLSRRQRALALQDLDFHAGLVVAVGGEDLRLAGRDRRVARDHRRGHAARRLDRQRERRHVEQEHVLHVALEHAALDRRADGDDFIRVHALVRLLADELARGLDDLRHAGHAADEHEFVDRPSRSRPASFKQSLHRARACARKGRR